MTKAKHRAGFTLVEMIIVIGIIGIMAAAVYPAIMNALRSRSLEGAARDISMDLNRAKIMAVKTKINTRLVFAQEEGQPWTYVLENESVAGTWTTVGGALKKNIPSEFQVTINLPDQSVVFSPLGLVENYTPGQNSISLVSPQMKRYNQPDVRNLNIYAGGSVQYVRTSS
jgi:type II secretion system protein H